MSLYIGNQKIPTLNVRLSSSGITNYQTKIINPSTSSQLITADSGYDALSQVTINAIQTEQKTVTTNGTVTPSSGKYLSKVIVNVPVGSTINNQDKSITPTENSQTISADSGYTGLGTVTVNAISSTYIGTGIARKSSSDLTVSGATISVPAGYYASAASKAVSSMTLPTSVATSSSGASKLTITPTTVARYLNIPTGYNGTASYYTISGDSNLIAGNIRSGISIFGVTGTYTGSGGTTINNQNKTVTPSTSQQNVTFDSGYTGLGTVTVNAISTQTKSATPSTSAQTITPDSGKYLTSVSISAIQTETKTATTNGDVTPSSGKYLTKVTVNVPTGSTINNQNKTITPTESQQSITADSGYTGLGTVTINAISSTYIGSGITSRSSSDLTVSGNTVTVPAGYYASAASGSVATMTLPTAASSTRSGTTKATIGRSTSAQYINIPVGYNSTAASYTISAVANGSVTAPSSISGTTATVSTGTNTLTLTKTVSVTPNVTTAGYISSGTAGNASVSLTASVTTKAATTYNVSTSDQTIASGTYLTGAQTFRAVTHTATAAKVAAGQTVTIGDVGSATRIANITGTFTSDATAEAADIASGKTAYVNGSKITGSLTFVNIHTGTSTPSSSLGNDGDIYIQS